MTFQRIVIRALLIIICLLMDNLPINRQIETWNQYRNWQTELEEDIKNWESRDNHSDIFTK